MNQQFVYYDRDGILMVQQRCTLNTGQEVLLACPVKPGDLIMTKEQYDAESERRKEEYEAKLLQQAIEQDEKHNAKKELRRSGLNKLSALGLTQEEINALVG